jgi:hypothetical protein
MVDGIDELTSARQRETVERELTWCDNRRADLLDLLRYERNFWYSGTCWDRVGEFNTVKEASSWLDRNISHCSDTGLDSATVKAQIRESMQEESLAKLCARENLFIKWRLIRKDHTIWPELHWLPELHT